MHITRTEIELRNFLTTVSSEQIGFVPTMGALHAGHLALIEKSKSLGVFTVCSIFVNPTQFNDPQDFEKYPVTLIADIEILKEAGCDLVFIPSVSEIYPNGITSIKKYALGYLENILEGKYRPGHFQGVCQVMDRLLNLVQPHYLLMGQKDYQQCKVIQKIIENNTFSFPIQFIGVPTVREQDGLAKSSRNQRLSPDDRNKATELYRSLQYIQTNIDNQPLAELVLNAKDQLTNAGFEKIDYIEIASAETLEPWNGQGNYVILAAAFLGGVRLIDNIAVTI